MSQLLNNFHNQNKNMLYLEYLSSVNRIFNEEEIYDKYKKQPKYKTVQKARFPTMRILPAVKQVFYFIRD